MTYFIARPFKFPDQIVENYERALLRNIKHNHYIISERFKSLDTKVFINQYNQDSIVDDINNIVNRLNEVLERDTMIIKTYEIADSLITFVREEMKSIFKSKVLVDYNIDISVNALNSFENQSILIRSWVDSNVKRIKGLNETQLADIAEIISRAYRAGFNYEVISKQIQNIAHVNENKAKLIARTELATLNSDYTRNENLKYGLKEYVWNTSNDERVRESHRVLNKKIMTWLDPKIFKMNSEDKKWFPKTVLPGSYKENGETIKGGVQKQVGCDFNCRCTSSIIVDLNKYKKSINPRFNYSF